MTREEAKEILKAYRNKLSDSVSNQLDKDIEAFNEAIQALEQTELKSSYNSIKTELNDDAISIQALKDLGAECIAKRDENGNLIPLGSIDSLPSISTENPNRSEIKQKCDRINSLASVLPYAPHREIQELLCEIMDMSYVSTEKTGRWEKLSIGYGCSECSLCTNKHGIEFYRYCPNCGAKMEMEE